MSESVDQEKAKRLRSRLARWFSRNARELPWRREPRDPWAVLVSEVMLQQTRVDVVAPRFEEFLCRWPTPADMAASTEEDVVAAWSGLGYYNRARRLHAAAVAVVEEHGGVFPRDAAALMALPGVGEYTAGALGSLSLDLPLPLVDGNVARVFARLFEIRGDVRRGPAARRVRDLAHDLVPQRDAGSWNEALMELGAIVCVPRSPRCGDCPLADDCRSLASGSQGDLPERPRRAKPRDVHLAAAYIEDEQGRVLLVRRPETGVLAGTWELPQVELGGEESRSRALGQALTESLGGAWAVADSCGAARHSILDMRIRCDVHRATVEGVVLTDGERRRWTDVAVRRDLATSSLVEKCLRVARAP
ncbi:MAG: A/G-specific adenine glycosylase [Planctomycetota bacterium]|jgi:A/G-specific adenine glycosylase